ncbi:MAG: septum formation initiator family protein [Flavobacteriales bacterium]|nr:septum formation initiator family protein [Flavobacteriales bacterium]
MKFNLSIPSYLKNKYALTIGVFLVWIAFFDQNNLITQYQYHAELNKLEEEKYFYQEELKIIQEDLFELQSNPKTLEKFAREKYLMKKDDEVLFVIIEED